MLELNDIKKDYVSGSTTVSALKCINLRFRDCEFVSILGQSGCGRLWEQCTLPLSEQSAALETAGHHILWDRHGSPAGLCDTVTDR